MFDVLLIVIFLGAIFLGVRMKGLGIAYAAGVGLFIITMVMKIQPGVLPFSVVIIIIAVIGAIGVLELSGGLDYMVRVSEKILRGNPKYINYLAPIITFTLTLLAGTGHVSYSVLPVIIEVAKRQNIKPVRPLTTAVVASQVGIPASPISAATVTLAALLAPDGVNLGQVILICIPSAFFALMVVAFLQSLLPQALDKDKTYLALLASGNIKGFEEKIKETQVKKEAKGSKGPLAVLIFLIAIVIIVLYGLFPELKPIYANTNDSIDMPLLIVIIMLVAAYIMVILTKVKVADIPKQATFQAGMSAALCVIGVAWLGDTVISHYSENIKTIAGDFLQHYPWAFAVVLFCVASLLYSPAATTIAIMPLGISLGLSPMVIIGSFAATSALFVLPTYPTSLAAVQMDNTGTTKMGKYVFNHSFIIPGTLVVIFSVMFSFIMASIVL
ncbi:anaerobic C4-dicarboxylate transporter [Candidatus Hepatincola sp. Av]